MGNTVAELMAKNISNAQTNAKNWKDIIYNVKDYGAKGDGETDDTADINRAILDCHENGGGTLVFPPGDYVITPTVLSPTRQAIQLLSGVSLIGFGTRLVLRGNSCFIGSKIPKTGVTTLITGNVAYGDTSLTVNSTSSFEVGNEISFTCGDNAWDPEETSYQDFAVITAIPNSTTLNLDRPINTTMTVADTEEENREVSQVRNIVENIVISGFDLYTDEANGGIARTGIDLRYVRNCYIENITGENVGAGIVALAFAHNVNGNLIEVRKSIRQTGQSWEGRAFNFWNCRNCKFENILVKYFEGIAGFFESYNRDISFKNIRLVNNHPTRNNSSTAFFSVYQASSVFFENLTLEGNGGANIMDQGGTVGNNYQIRNLTVYLKTWFAGSLVISRISGIFRLTNPDTLETRYFNMDRVVEREVVINLVDNMNNYYDMPKGLWVRHGFQFSSNVVSGDVETLRVSRETQNGNDVKDVPYTEIGVEGFRYPQMGSTYNTGENKYDEKTRVYINTINSGIGTGKTLTVRIAYVPPQIGVVS